MNELKVWQSTLWVGETNDQPIIISANSLANLPVEIEKWLTENPPIDFCNSSPDSDIRKRVSCFYSDGTLQPAFPLNAKTLEEGWYFIGGEFGRPQRLENFAKVIEHFVSQHFIVEKGVDYKEIPLVESGFPTHLIKTIHRENDVTKTNDMLQRGWYILSLDFDGKMDYYGDKVMTKTTIFVLGHPEENAY